jgi:hypothetical protein
MTADDMYEAVALLPLPDNVGVWVQETSDGEDVVALGDELSSRFAVIFPDGVAHMWVDGESFSGGAAPDGLVEGAPLDEVAEILRGWFS